MNNPKLVPGEIVVRISSKAVVGKEFTSANQILWRTTTASKVSVFGVFLVRIFPYSVQTRESKDQKNSEYRQFLRSEHQFYTFI